MGVSAHTCARVHGHGGLLGKKCAGAVRRADKPKHKIANSEERGIV